MIAGTARTRTIAATLLAITFVVGVAAGVVVDRIVSPQPKIRVLRNMSGVLDKLGLTPEQRRQANSIVQSSAPGTEAAMRLAAAQLRAQADSVDAKLRAILTAEQRARLDSLRPQSVLMLKRKTPGGETVDTVFPPIPRQRTPRR